MKIIDQDINKLIPYENNPRINDQAVEELANSIREFGFKNPIVVDKNNVVINGHTRLKACKLLGYKTVPTLIADDLTPEQVKAYRLADNKVAENSKWDKKLLKAELEGLGDLDLSFDMVDFGFMSEEEHAENQANTQNLVTNILNLGHGQFLGDGKYDIPMLLNNATLPKNIEEWIPFNCVLTETNPKNKGVHFFIDDYQFERVWNKPEKYVEKLKKFAIVCAPDFSPYGNMPMATQIYNHYRKHWVARYWQEHGVNVISTIRASTNPESLKWYLDGNPEGMPFVISNMWTGERYGDGKKYFLQKEFKKAYETIKPRRLYVYGRPMEELPKDAVYIETYADRRHRNGENK